jgi:tRNA threonylcarbamoyladenosine biosynthesis protein TsaB
MFLGINLAIEPYSIAFTKDNQLIAELSMQGSYDFSEDLILEIERLAKISGLDLKDLQGIGVTVGPGSYTGLRIGITTAKSIAQILKIPVYGISTLAALAWQIKDFDSVCFSIIPARKNEVNVAMFGLSNQQLNRLTENFVWDFETMLAKLAQIKGLVYVLGLIPSDLAAKITNRHIRVLNLPLKAVSLAQLAQRNFVAKKSGDYLLLHPKYSHLPNLGKRKK